MHLRHLPSPEPDILQVWIRVNSQSRLTIKLPKRNIVDTNKLINLILKKEWNFYVTRKFNWFVQNTQILANSVMTLTKYVGFDSSQENYLILNGDEYYADEETLKYNKVFESLAGKDTLFFVNLTKREFKIVDEIKSYITRLKSRNLEILTDEQLTQEIMDFQEVYTLSFVPAFSRPDDFLEEKTKDLIRINFKTSEKKTDEIFSLIATYPALGKLAYTDEPLELLIIAKLIKDKGYKLNNVPKNIKKKLDDHINKYSWMKGSVFTEDISFSEEEYFERLMNMQNKNINEDIRRIENVRRENQINYDILLKEYKFDDKLKRFADAVRNFIFLRTYTTEVSDNLFYIGRHTLLAEASKRLNISSENITMLNSQEITDLLQKKPSNLINLIPKRKKGYAIVWIDGEAYTLFGSDSIKLQSIIANKFKGKEAKQKAKLKYIKGTPASLGKTKGIVKVLLSHLDAGKLDKGDILVASMTTPDYIIAMEKAAAFVTDEGGITCHAAIVAREFGVPCIVGTGNATALLKDGDFVEVDAEKGLIKILN